MYKGMCVLISFFSEVNKQLFGLFDDGGVVSHCYTVSTGGHWVHSPGGSSGTEEVRLPIGNVCDLFMKKSNI